MLTKWTGVCRMANTPTLHPPPTPTPHVQSPDPSCPPFSQPSTSVCPGSGERQHHANTVYICVSQRHSSFLSFYWVMRWAGRVDWPLLTLGASWGKETYCWKGVEVTYTTFVLFFCNGRVEGREGWCGVRPPNTDVILQEKMDSVLRWGVSAVSSVPYLLAFIPGKDQLVFFF